MFQGVAPGEAPEEKKEKKEKTKKNMKKLRYKKKTKNGKMKKMEKWKNGKMEKWKKHGREPLTPSAIEGVTVIVGTLMSIRNCQRHGPVSPSSVC